MPRRKKPKPLMPATKMSLIREGRAYATMLSNVLKSLEYYPKAVDKMLHPILKVLKNIETAAKREEKRRKE